eukprot:TRINITY_DN11386_c0_g3_i1.p1 TRINITY_DN11386_c0_g3~~TRINITY_DN11386_c0_g3_i1.p1  ORF type:complete len:120 (+),score=12.97 TRINITY_DN11386_c0_g3_i1:1424-1783(+)
MDSLVHSSLSQDIVGHDVCAAVGHCFISGRLLHDTNTYFMALIPKSTSHSSFSDFHPISLLNFSYKTISKIMALRLPLIIIHLISSSLITRLLLLRAILSTNILLWPMNFFKSFILKLG